ncbi:MULTISPECIES: hypothetical protein [Burkholderia]|uniref:hypothetical protein n=1 Tax=Burkholderia TaxID=32008 RepID=UPI000B2E1C7D|nr:MULTISPECIES: hypothetical protein [Burkholderia]
MIDPKLIADAQAFFPACLLLAGASWRDAGSPCSFSVGNECGKALNYKGNRFRRSKKSDFLRLAPTTKRASQA